MNVVFWSSVPGMSAVSSSMLGTALATAIVHKVKCSVTQLQLTGNNLFPAIITPDDNESIQMFENVGIDALIRMACGGEVIQGNEISDVGFSFAGGKFNVFAESKQKNEEVYKSDLLPVLPHLLELLDNAFKINFIDVPAGLNAYSKEALQNADIIVVCLPAVKSVIQQFFDDYQFPKERLFIMLGNHDAGSNVNAGTVYANFRNRVHRNNIIEIVHCTEYANAMNNGKVLAFFAQNINSAKQDSCNAFIRSCSESAMKLLNRKAVT